MGHCQVQLNSGTIPVWLPTFRIILNNRFLHGTITGITKFFICTFRYSPMMHPVYMKFPVAGVQVQDGKYFCNESTCRVDLSLVGAKSTGTYKCEVSGDAPHFKLAAKGDNMTVAGKNPYSFLATIETQTMHTQYYAQTEIVSTTNDRK